MIRVKDVEAGMDYIIKNEEVTLLVEQRKNQTKNHIIDQYIEIRKKKGLSQEKIAQLTGMARTNIVRIERKTNMPTIDVLVKLADAMDMDLEIKFVERVTK